LYDGTSTIASGSGYQATYTTPVDYNVTTGYTTTTTPSYQDPTAASYEATSSSYQDPAAASYKTTNTQAMDQVVAGMQKPSTANAESNHQFVKVTRKAHTLHKTEYIFKDRKGKLRTTELEDWVEGIYNGESAWMYRDKYICCDKNVFQQQK